MFTDKDKALICKVADVHNFKLRTAIPRTGTLIFSHRDLISTMKVSYNEYDLMKKGHGESGVIAWLDKKFGEDV